MNTVSFINNFKNRRALIVSEDFSAIGKLGESLKRMGVSVEYIAPKNEEVDLVPFQPREKEDVIFLDGDLNTNINLPHCERRKIVLVPVIGMIGIEAPSRLDRLLSYGATSFIKKPIHVGTVFFNLYLAVNTHNKFMRLHREVEKHNERRSMRKYILKAILIVMEQYKVSDDAAYDLIRKRSMDAQISLEEYSKKIVCLHSQSEPIA